MFIPFAPSRVMSPRRRSSNGNNGNTSNSSNNVSNSNSTSIVVIINCLGCLCIFTSVSVCNHRGSNTHSSSASLLAGDPAVPVLVDRVEGLVLRVRVGVLQQ